MVMIVLTPGQAESARQVQRELCADAMETLLRDCPGLDPEALFRFQAATGGNLGSLDRDDFLQAGRQAARRLDAGWQARRENGDLDKPGI